MVIHTHKHWPYINELPNMFMPRMLVEGFLFLPEERRMILKQQL